MLHVTLSAGTTDSYVHTYRYNWKRSSFHHIPLTKVGSPLLEQSVGGLFGALLLISIITVVVIITLFLLVRMKKKEDYIYFIHEGSIYLSSEVTTMVTFTIMARFCYQVLSIVVLFINRTNE